MLWITGKYAVRFPYEQEMGLLRYCLTAYNEICRFLGKEEIVITNEVLTAPTPKAKIQKLAYYADILKTSCTISPFPHRQNTPKFRLYNDRRGVSKEIGDILCHRNLRQNA